MKALISAEHWVRERAEQEPAREKDCVLEGCIGLYAATGEKLYRDYVIGCCSRMAASGGTGPESAGPSRAFFFALDETGDELYREAIERRMEEIRNIHEPDRAGGDPLFTARADRTAALQPFCAAYEMRFGGKRGIGDVARRFRFIHENCFDKDRGLYVFGQDRVPDLRAEGRILTALTDSAGIISEQLYEHRRALTDLFREGIRGLLKYADEESGMFYRRIDRADPAGADTAGTALAVYAILGGVRMGFLSAEKTRPWGIRAFESLLSLSENENGTFSGAGPACDCPDAGGGEGPFLMALGEYLLAGKEF